MTAIRDDASLIMTVLNEAESIGRFLDSLPRQRVLPAEIVVVDGGSTDGTVEMIRSWTPPDGCGISVIVEPGANISRGRNLAIERAANERILVTDAGTTLDPEWASRMLDAFDREPAPAVVSGFFRPDGNGFIERAIAVTVTPAIEEIDPERFLPSSRSLGLTRQAWLAAGGYPEWLDYCEDLVLDLRMRQLGFPFAFVGDAIVTWSARHGLRPFMTQYYRYARGDGKAGLWAKRHLARYLAYLIGLAGLCAAIVQPLALVPLAVGFCAYVTKSWRRVYRGRALFGAGLAIAVALVPVIVVSGDLAKMAGYPAGLLWRRRNQPGAAMVGAES